VQKHGDGIADIAFTVPDARAAYDIPMRAGARFASAPVETKDEFGAIVTAGIYTYGKTRHTFVRRENFKSFLPNFRLLPKKRTRGIGLLRFHARTPVFRGSFNGAHLHLL
jgi:4-hydroxyphenylpyruvate dioxygenase-like putative hemolysin